MRPAQVVLLVLALFTYDCSDNGVQSDGNENLLPNSSFERSGEPTLEGWTPANARLAEIVETSAPGGGQYALQLEADWWPTSGFVTAVVHGLHNGDIVQLNANVKAVGRDGGGSIWLMTGPSLSQAMLNRNGVVTTKTDWMTLSVTDTLSLSRGDSVWVQLSSLPTEVAQRVGYFDLVELRHLSH